MARSSFQIATAATNALTSGSAGVGGGGINSTSTFMHPNAAAGSAVNKLHDAKDFVRNSFKGGDQAETPSAY